MPTIVQFRRGTQTQNNNFQGASGELSINTTSKSLRVHDGSQLGGYELARADLSNVTNNSLSSLSIGSTEVLSSDFTLKNISAIDATTKNTFESELVDNLSGTVNVNTTGIITASSFYGSAVGLTSIPSSQLTGALPALDGSALFGIVATSSSGVPLLINDNPLGTATTINFSYNFSGQFASGIATIGISPSSSLTVKDVLTPTHNNGTVGSSSTYWGTGYFQNFDISNVLNVREAIDLGDSDILRLGASDDAQFLYNGSTNKLILDLQSDCTDFVISSSNSSKFIFNKTNGRLGIGSDVPTEPLDVLGNIKSTGSVSASDFNSTSDINLKTNIEDINNALDIISKINGVKFDWISNGETSIGVIAQNIEMVLPELVSNKDSIKRVNYNGIVAILIEAIKELQDEVKVLKSKIL
jgi:hypothetical protein